MNIIIDNPEVSSLSIAVGSILEALESDWMVGELKNRGYRDWIDHATDSEVEKEFEYRDLSDTVALRNVSTSEIQSEIEGRGLRVIDNENVLDLDDIATISYRMILCYNEGYIDTNDVRKLLETITGGLVWSKSKTPLQLK